MVEKQWVCVVVLASLVVYDLISTSTLSSKQEFSNQIKDFESEYEAFVATMKVAQPCNLFVIGRLFSPGLSSDNEQTRDTPNLAGLVCETLEKATRYVRWQPSPELAKLTTQLESIGRTFYKLQIRVLREDSTKADYDEFDNLYAEFKIIKGKVLQELTTLRGQKDWVTKLKEAGVAVLSAALATPSALVSISAPLSFTAVFTAAQAAVASAT